MAGPNEQLRGGGMTEHRLGGFPLTPLVVDSSCSGQDSDESAPCTEAEGGSGTAVAAPGKEEGKQ